MTDTHVLDNPHAISDVTCACGCGILMPIGWLRNGRNGTTRRFLYGHKPAKQPKIREIRGLKNNPGSEFLEVYFTAKIEYLIASGSNVKGEAQKLFAYAKKKMRKAQEIDEQITEIKTLQKQNKDALGRIFKSQTGE